MELERLRLYYNRGGKFNVMTFKKKPLNSGSRFLRNQLNLLLEINMNTKLFLITVMYVVMMTSGSESLEVKLNLKQ